MKKIKRMEEFVHLYFVWILIGILHVCSVSCSISDSDSVDANVFSITINKCEPDLFNSAAEIERFTSVFGYVQGRRLFNFKFVSNFNSKRSKNGCKSSETVEIPFNFTSSSTSKSISMPACTSMETSSPTDETNTTNFVPGFWNHGFVNPAPNFYINPQNYCVKSLKNPECKNGSEWILTLETCSNIEASTSNQSNSIPRDSTCYFPPTFEKCCNVEHVLTVDEDGNATCKGSKNPPWKSDFMEKKEIYPNYISSALLCRAVQFILPQQLEGKIQRGKKTQFKFEDIRVLENGEVERRETGNHGWEKLESTKYCIDRYFHQVPSGENTENETETEMEPVNGISADIFLVLKCTPEPSPFSKIKDLIYTATAFISSFVLLLILVIFGLIWTEQNVQGWTKAAFSLVLFSWFFCTGVRLVYKKDEGDDDGFCVFIAVACLFSRISVFSWMLLLNFDLWSTISSVTTVRQRSAEHQRFFFYCLLSSAIPTIVITISLFIEHQFGLHDDRVIRPQYGRSRCSLDHTAVPYYAIYPTMILFFPNFIFLFLTIQIVLGLEKGRKKLKRQNSTTAATQNNNNIEMILYLKLFVIMGISWISDIISGLMDTDEVSWYWMITDIYNIFQPFLLFWLFICNKTTREQLTVKYPLFKAGFEWIEAHLPRGFSTTTREQKERKTRKPSGVTIPGENSLQPLIHGQVSTNPLVSELQETKLN